jgi:hypothetical protein
MWLNRQESAEAIVPPSAAGERAEHETRGSSFEFERGAAENFRRRLSTGGSGEYARHRGSA